MPPVSALAYILLFVVGCSTALFVDATYGILLYVFAYFMNPPGRWWGEHLPDLRYSFIIGIITLIGYLISRGRYSDNKVFDAPQTKWLLLMGLLMILMYPIAVNQIEHSNFLIIFIKYILFYLLVIKIIDTPEKFEKLLGIFLLGQFYLGWIAHESGRGSEDRLEKLGGTDCSDSNGAAALMIVAVPIAIHYLIVGRKWQKICALPILVFILNAVILVNSRGAFVALLVSMAYYFFLSLKSPAFPKFNKSKVLLAVAGGAAIFMYLADPVFLNRMATIEAEDAEVREGYTGRERMDFWMKTFDVVRDHPLGTGAMGFDFLSSQYLPPETLNPITHTRAVHSLFFQVFAEYGYHGFIIFMIFLYANFRYLKKLKKSLKQRKYYEPYYLATALEAGYLAVLTAGIFISTFYMEVNYWMAAFFAAYGNIYFKEIKRLDNYDVKDMDTYMTIDMKKAGNS